MTKAHFLAIHSLKKALKHYKMEVKRPGTGSLLYDYLIPAGVYEEQFDWDAFFIGMALSAELASEAIYLRNVALNFILNCEEDGFTPGAFGPRGRDVEINHIKPFLAQMVYFSSKYIDAFDWIAPHYHALKRIVLYREHHLWDKQRDLGVWFDACESGIDNNVTVLDYPAGSVIGADCNTYIYREYRAFSFLAAELGHTKDSSYFSARAETIRKNMQSYLWDETDQSYYNLDTRKGTLIKRMSCSNFIPLWEKLASPTQGRKMIERYLLSPNKLWSPYGIRTLSKDDPQYNNENMIKPYSNWRGPVWPLTNYLCMHILINYGYRQEAILLAERTTDLLLKDIKQHGGMHENYDAETGKPLAAPHFVSWNLLVGNMLEEALFQKNPFALSHEYQKPSQVFRVLDTSSLKKASDAFAEEIRKEKSGHLSSLSAYIHPFTRVPSVSQSAIQGMVFVANGMVGKSAEWKLNTDGIQITDSEIFTLPVSSSKEEYFRLLTQKITPHSSIAGVGFNMGYALEPYTRDHSIDGKLLRFAKEHYIKGLKGHFVGKELEEYLYKQKNIETRVTAANDIICLLLSGLQQKKPSFPTIAGMVGQGMNFAFLDEASRWNAKGELVAINLEAANFNRFSMTEAGKAIDETSEYPQKALAEKEASSSYLFLLYNWIMKQAYGHRADLISNTSQLDHIAASPSHQGYTVANQLLERSAQLAAVELTGILQYLGKTEGTMEIIMAGSLFWRGYRYKDRVLKWIHTVLPHIDIRFLNIPNSDLVGAAALTTLHAS